jgi:tetratricopeptide (TPR) repeat protein
MSVEAQSKQEALAARYNLPAQPEWQQFLNHFDLSENFALVVLLVTDADGAELCRMELEKQLQQEGKKLVPLEVSTPEILRNLPTQLLATQLPADAGGLWIAAVATDYSKDFSAWQEAWQFALARLNPRRNEIRRQFNCALIFVGAPWLQQTMREIAPDLWSVRTLVARIEPQGGSQTPSSASQTPSSSSTESSSGSDPIFALQEAEKLRGVPGKELVLARLLHRAGEGFEARDDWRSAEKTYHEALQLKQQFGAPPDSVLTTLHRLTWTCSLLGQVRRSLDYAQSALAIARQTGNRIGEGVSIGYLGNAYYSLGDVRKAIEFYGQSLEIQRELGDLRGESASLGNLGNAYADLGDSHKAIEFYEQQLVIVRETGNRRGEGDALGNLGLAYADLGDARKAIEFQEQRLVIAREVGDRLGEGAALGSLGTAHFALGNTRKAIEFYEQYLAITVAIGDRRGEGNALGNLGLAYTDLGDVRKGIEFYEQQLVIAREIGDRRGEGSGLWNSALAHNLLRNRAEAITRAEAALKIFEAIEEPRAAKVRAQLAEWRKPA